MTNGDILRRFHAFISDDNASQMFRRFDAVKDLINFTDFKVCFDIGSRDMKEAVTMGGVFSDAKIYSFEASPDCIEFCKKTYESLNEDLKSRLSLQPYALNDVSGEISFYPLDESRSEPRWGNYNYGVASKNKLIDGLNGTFLGEYWVQKEIKVKAYSMDDFCIEHGIDGPDFIWMDVQGAELDVLKGGKNCLKNTKIIMTEAGIKPYYEKHSLLPDIDNFLTSIGFREIEDVRLRCHDFEYDVVYINTRKIK